MSPICARFLAELQCLKRCSDMIGMIMFDIVAEIAVEILIVASGVPVPEG